EQGGKKGDKVCEDRKGNMAQLGEDGQQGDVKETRALFQPLAVVVQYLPIGGQRVSRPVGQVDVIQARGQENPDPEYNQDNEWNDEKPGVAPIRRDPGLCPWVTIRGARLDWHWLAELIYKARRSGSRKNANPTAQEGRRQGEDSGFGEEDERTRAPVGGPGERRDELLTARCTRIVPLLPVGS